MIKAKIKAAAAGGLVMAAVLQAPAPAQDAIPIPGTPNGDLPTELLQCRTYCRSMEWQINNVEKAFPELAFEVVAARSTWLSSPFAIGCDAIEKDIIGDAGDNGKKMLAELDKATQEGVAKLGPAKTMRDAQDFLQLVGRRAKGGIEVGFVRGNLLWQYKPYQDAPEKEFAAGFTQSMTHTTKSGLVITFDVPMSWKTDASPNAELMSFRNCYGHGNIWMTVLVSPTTDPLGGPIPAEEKFAWYTEDNLRDDYLKLGITLTSFTRTKVNGMSALMFTRKQLYEQLGVKATRAAEVIRAFHRDHMISFQINTLGTEGTPVAETRIRKNSNLFRMIGGSFRIALK